MVEMGYEARTQWLDNGRVLVECGPMRLVISAWVGKVSQKEACIRAAKEAVSLLETVARQRKELSRCYERFPCGIEASLVKNMIQSVLAVDSTLTPMAAVAGTISDGVADFLFNRGMTKVIVNNGGDIAIRTGTDQTVNVGIRPDLMSSSMTHMLTIGHEYPSWGVATSGLEGRSFTRGVASAATVVAKSASLADAAATAIANASFVKDKSVIQKPARKLDDQTDIPDVRVTIQAGPLSDEKKDAALSGAIEKAEALIEDKLILGAYVVVDGKVRMTDFVRNRLTGLIEGNTR